MTIEIVIIFWSYSMASTKKPQKKDLKSIKINITKTDAKESKSFSAQKKSTIKKTLKSTPIKTKVTKAKKTLSKKSSASKKTPRTNTLIVPSLYQAIKTPSFFRLPTIRTNFSSIRLPRIQAEDTVFMGAFVIASTVIFYVLSTTTLFNNYPSIFATDVLASFQNTPQVIQTQTITTSSNSDLLKQVINTSIDTDEQKARQALMGFYINMNNKEFWQAYQFIQTNLYKTDIFQQYFKTERLWSFLSFIEDNKVKIDNVSFQTDPENSERLIATYTLTYTLKTNQTIYKENRTTKLKKINGKYQIVEFMCDTKGCSRMPFFNFEKFGLK